MIKVAINGFGRIGRQAFKIALEKPELEVVGINNLSGPEVAAHLLKYDSVYGRYHHGVSFDEKNLIVDGKKYPMLAEKDPEKLPWKDWGVDVVVDCTGVFTTTEKASAHLRAGARKVVISAPAKDLDITPSIVLGVNEAVYKGESVISCGSCTTNCITPVLAVMEQAFGIEKLMMTTIHSYTAEQNLIDGNPPGKHSNDLRRARAAAVNIVPTSTGAAKVATEAIPELKGKFHGIAIRVPTPVGSLSDFVMLLKKNAAAEQINQAFLDAAQSPRYKGIIEATYDQIVSTDIIGNSASAIVDLSLTKVVDGNLAKVVAWYDNEYGYSHRLIEEVIMVGKK